MLDTQLDKKILDWISENREQVISDWMDLVRIPSVNGEAAPLAPYGVHCAQALKKAAEHYEKRSFAPKVNEAEGYALVSYGSGSKTISRKLYPILLCPEEHTDLLTIRIPMDKQHRVSDWLI